MKRLAIVFATGVLVWGASGRLLAQSDAHIGTWKLNVAKSKFDPGPASKSETRKYEATDGGYKFSGTTVTADGSTHTSAFTVKYDGKDYPYTADPNGADTLAVKLVDANHLDSTAKKGGKMLYTSKVVVSDGGKVMTISSKGTNGSGKAFNNVLVYDRQ
jgi:hypothetical protein